MGSAAKLIVQTAVRPADIRRLHYELHYNRPAWLAPAALVVSAAGSAAACLLLRVDRFGWLLCWLFLSLVMGVTLALAVSLQYGLFPRKGEATEATTYRFYKDWCMVGDPLGTDVRIFEYDKLTLVAETRTCFAAYVDTGTLAAVIKKRDLSESDKAAMREILHRAANYRTR